MEYCGYEDNDDSEDQYRRCRADEEHESGGVDEEHESGGVEESNVCFEADGAVASPDEY